MINILEKLFGASWRTAVWAFTVFIGVVISQIGNNFDNDPNTVFDMNNIFHALGTFLNASGILGFGLTARDNKVSSEEVKLKG